MTDLLASGSDGGGRPTHIEKTTRVKLRQAHIQVCNTLSCLEKAMSKHGVTCRALKIQENALGTDYWFSDRTHALDLVQFIEGVVPVKKKSNDDGVSATFFSLYILSICRNDLILGSVVGVGDKFVICTGVAAHGISLMDPFTLHTAFLTAEAYWRAPCTVLMFGCKLMAEYLVLDIVTITPLDDSYCLTDAHIVQVLDLGRTDDYNKSLVWTHLGRLLKSGDYVLGYEFAGILVKKKSVAKPTRSVDTELDGDIRMLFLRGLDRRQISKGSQVLPTQLSSLQQIHGQQNCIGDIQQLLQRNLLDLQRILNEGLMYMHQQEQQSLGSLPTTSNPQACQGAILVLKQAQRHLTQLLSDSLQEGEMHQRLQGPSSLLQAHNAIEQKPLIQALQEVSLAH